MKRKIKFFIYQLSVITISLVLISGCDDDDAGPNDISNIEYGEGVIDIDGNEYITVIIGENEWMAENLRVTKYNDSTAISTDLDDAAWQNTNSGAYAIFPHDNVSGVNSNEQMVNAYGKLYNWFAVNDERGLCPEGWHVPSDDEWTELITYVVSLGFPNTGNLADGAGNALKSCRQPGGSNEEGCNTTEHPFWNRHDKHYGFDEFAFSALPGGHRAVNGEFFSIGDLGDWWTATENEDYGAWANGMSNKGSGVGRGSSLNKNFGLSIRCVKDLDSAE